MWLCLLIALALLGRVPVSCSAVASPAVEDEEDVTELEMPEEYSGCLGASEKQALGVPSMPGTATCRYVLISRCRSFYHAQVGWDGLWRSVRCKSRLPFICEI
ncbi:hypothetical protein HGM15179_005798 [Zosterops borbonicus]|uniref:Uncharacterized protein n=1 Tax=Zosterops borbonicus TaxID=364589 RepID=A0A8K1LPF2_9PASS|nr:hypothetical protein HGM15179_005798 [Zosterops borbonicus]